METLRTLTAFFVVALILHDTLVLLRVKGNVSMAFCLVYVLQIALLVWLYSIGG